MDVGWVGGELAQFMADVRVICSRRWLKLRIMCGSQCVQTLHPFVVESSPIVLTLGEHLGRLLISNGGDSTRKMVGILPANRQGLERNLRVNSLANASLHAQTAQNPREFGHIPVVRDYSQVIMA
jgi:hypothetical protein